jgi:RNA recognition motif-containing protein
MARLKNEIIVEIFDQNAPAEQIVTMFSEVGKVVDIRMKQDSGRSQSYGFVIEFDNAEACKAAISLFDGRLFNQRQIKGMYSVKSNSFQLKRSNNVVASFRRFSSIY